VVDLSKECIHHNNNTKMEDLILLWANLMQEGIMDNRKCIEDISEVDFGGYREYMDFFFVWKSICNLYYKLCAVCMNAFI